MTWWGALGLALALYGLVVLLEWIYGKLLATPDVHIPHVSVVLSLTNQEAQIERAIRQLQGLWQDTAQTAPRLEFILVEHESHDQTPAILDRLARQYPAIHVVSAALGKDAILSRCRYPIILWVELTDSDNVSGLLATVQRMLFFHPPMNKISD
ncbi:hypothetical protein TPY_0820 [Sulfobacillus acidophilus TPY]|uniref:Glycosyltransferase 2-like domain-containing protein n=1 Tax=Sulfobacillus acidophilus (strain ATCC 700253 / DSM 10332 / NAL) TaxID=679936 RepID=G8TYM1_SULAD|nr:hypothetical protein TPY_0820 [Sulfobacillus acidophilus TPY]AEW06282.1 hypothetical protein Sulac_2821 [Sulfobacillus acidophilus DSM 10332]